MCKRGGDSLSWVEKVKWFVMGSMGEMLCQGGMIAMDSIGLLVCHGVQWYNGLSWAA